MSGLRPAAVGLPAVTDAVERFWAAMQRNAWTAAAACFIETIEIDWPCSGERIVGRADFVALQERYPTRTGRWEFDVHRLVDDGRTTASEVTVTDGVQSARVVAFSDVVDDQIIRHVEYWPAAYEPPPERADLVVRIPPIP